MMDAFLGHQAPFDPREINIRANALEMYLRATGQSDLGPLGYPPMGACPLFFNPPLAAPPQAPATTENLNETQSGV